MLGVLYNEISEVTILVFNILVKFQMWFYGHCTFKKDVDQLDRVQKQRKRMTEV